MSHSLLSDDVLAIVLRGQTIGHLSDFIGDGPSGTGSLEGAYMREMVAVKAELDSGPKNRKERRAAEAKERSRRPAKKWRY